MSLSQDALKERISQAVFDALDELETELDLTVQQEADQITDAVFNALSEEMDDDSIFPQDESLTDEEPDEAEAV